MYVYTIDNGGRLCRSESGRIPIESTESRCRTSVAHEITSRGITNISTTLMHHPCMSCLHLLRMSARVFFVWFITVFISILLSVTSFFHPFFQRIATSTRLMVIRFWVLRLRTLKTEDRITRYQMAGVEMHHRKMRDQKCMIANWKMKEHDIYDNQFYHHVKKWDRLYLKRNAKHWREKLTARFFKRQVLASSSPLHYMLPDHRDNDTISRLRNPKPFHTIRARTNKFRESFLSYTVWTITHSLIVIVYSTQKISNIALKHSTLIWRIDLTSDTAVFTCWLW